MEVKVLSALQLAKPKLEDKYHVRIPTSALDAVVYGLKAFDSSLPSEEESIEKAVEILEGASKLVLEKFRNFEHEREFYCKQYELQRALVDVTELYRDDHPDSQSWVTRVRSERDRASFYMNDYVRSSESYWLVNDGHYAVKGFALKLMKGESTGRLTGERLLRDISLWLDQRHGKVINCFKNLLTLEPCHVAEVVSSLTDVPPDEILPSISHRKETAIQKTKQRLLNVDRVVDGVFEILASGSRTNARPRGLFLLLGSSGTGKTEIAKAVAQHWYSDVHRLVEIDMSEYAEPHFESCDLSAWSKRKRENLLNRFLEVLRKRPYSVILLDKIDKAATSVRSFLLEVLSDGAPSDVEGNTLDFTKSIVFMTSSIGADQLSLVCTGIYQDKNLWKQFMGGPIKSRKLHICSLKGSGHERVVVEARKFFGVELLDSMDQVFVMDLLHDEKAVSRVLLREIVGQVFDRRVLVHISNEALNVVLWNARTKSSKAGNAIKESLLEVVVPRLSAAEGCNGAVVCVDTLVGTHELSFRFEALKQSIADCYFKQEDGKFEEVMDDIRARVQWANESFELREKCLCLLDHSDPNLNQVGEYLSVICDLLSRFAWFLRPPKNYYAYKEGAKRAWASKLCRMRKEEEENEDWRSLPKIDTYLSKATHIIVDAVVKITDSPLQLPDSPPKYYLFLCLDDDAKGGLIKSLTESFRSDFGKSPFTCVRLNSNCRGEEVKGLLIKEAKESPCPVFLLDGVEYADAVLYSCLLEIFDRGGIDNGEGSTIDFGRSIFILTSEATNKRIVQLFGCQPYVSCNKATNQNGKRFRSELLHRVDEIMIFNPLLPEHGGICRLPKRNIRYMGPPDDTHLDAYLCEVFAANQYEDWVF